MGGTSGPAGHQPKSMHETANYQSAETALRKINKETEGDYVGNGGDTERKNGSLPPSDKIRSKHGDRNES